MVRNFSRLGMLFSILHKNLCCQNEMCPHTAKQRCTGRTLWAYLESKPVCRYIVKLKFVSPLLSLSGHFQSCRDGLQSGPFARAVLTVPYVSVSHFFRFSFQFYLHLFMCRVRFRHRNHLVRVRKSLCFDLKYLLLS